MIKRILLVLSVFMLVSCGGDQQTAGKHSSEDTQLYKWRLVTSWPKNFPGLGRAPEKFADLVGKMSNGRLTVKVYGAGELVPGFDVFETVSKGEVAELGHSAAYYWKGKIPAAQIFGAMPFGMNVIEMNAWLHYGGGIELWRELYAPFGIEPMAGGNTGVQFAGWFKKEINTPDDLKGLKMRIPGLAGEVLRKMGGLPVALTGGEIFTSLQSGAIDATEWVGPYNDLSFGLHKAAEYYYYSGWHEPSTTAEFLVNQEAMNTLPEDLQTIIRVAAKAVNQDLLDEYTARNHVALNKLLDEHKVELRKFSPEIMAQLKSTTADVVKDMVASDEQFARVWKSYSEFMASIQRYHELSEKEYYINRDGR